MHFLSQKKHYRPHPPSHASVVPEGGIWPVICGPPMSNGHSSWTYTEPLGNLPNFVLT